MSPSVPSASRASWPSARTSLRSGHRTGRGTSSSSIASRSSSSAGTARARKGVDALVVGYHEVAASGSPPRCERDSRHICARDFTHSSRSIRQMPVRRSPSSKTTHWGGGVTAEQMSEMRWVKPTLVAQVRFVEWTAEGHLRHAAFLGIRRTSGPRRCVERPDLFRHSPLHRRARTVTVDLCACSSSGDRVHRPVRRRRFRAAGS